MRRFRRRHQDGQALVEFAVVANILVVLLLAIVQFGIVWMNYIAVTDAAREGARRAAVNRSSGQATMVSSAIVGGPGRSSVAAAGEPEHLRVVAERHVEPGGSDRGDREVPRTR